MQRKRNPFIIRCVTEKDHVTRKQFCLSIVVMISSIATAQVPVDPISGANGFYFVSYSNLRIDLNGDSTVYEQDKLIFGFRSQLYPSLSAIVGIDFYRPSEKDARQFTPYLKPVVLTYNRNKLTLDFGIFFTSQFDMQRSYWGHRYISKTLHNKYHFGYSADLGIRAKYEFNEVIAFDAAVVNGNGYKYVRVASPLKPACALYLTPLSGLTLKMYCERYSKSVTQSVIGGFIDYRLAGRFSVSGEYGMVRNTDFISGLHRTGVSVYSFCRLNKNFGAVIRYDRVTVTYGDADRGDIEAGRTFIGGFECYPFQRVRLAATFQNLCPEQQGLPDEAGLFFQLEFRY